MWWGGTGSAGIAPVEEPAIYTSAHPDWHAMWSHMYSVWQTWHLHLGERWCEWLAPEGTPCGCTSASAFYCASLITTVLLEEARLKPKICCANHNISSANHKISSASSGLHPYIRKPQHIFCCMRAMSRQQTSQPQPQPGHRGPCRCCTCKQMQHLFVVLTCRLGDAICGLTTLPNDVVSCCGPRLALTASVCP